MDTLREKLSSFRVKNRKPARTAAPGQMKSLNVQIAQKSEQKGVIDGKLFAHIEPHVKNSCRQLCQRLHSVLPREIRDIIYEYIYVQETIYVGPEYFLNPSQPSEKNRGAHIWDASYVGSDIQREFVESWYRTSLFYFYDNAENARVVTQFLDFDRWGLGLKPSDFICKVRFEFGAADCKFHNKKNCCSTEDFPDTLTKPLKNLHQLPNHVHFLIRIHTYGAIKHDCINEDEVRRSVDALLSDLKNLKAAGHRWVVQWSELSDLEFCWRIGGYDAGAWMKEIMEAIRLLRVG